MIAPENEQAQNLDRLLRRYREATEYGDAGPNFMPLLWQKIEARRRNSVMVERFARLFATATVAVTVLVAAAFLSFGNSRSERDSWVETLANQHLAQNVSYYEPVRLSTAGMPENGK